MSVLSIGIEEDLDQLLGKRRWEETLEALEDIRMGRIIEGNKVHAWLESWGTAKESKATMKFIF